MKAITAFGFLALLSVGAAAIAWQSQPPQNDEPGCCGEDSGEYELTAEETAAVEQIFADADANGVVAPGTVVPGGIVLQPPSDDVRYTFAIPEEKQSWGAADKIGVSQDLVDQFGDMTTELDAIEAVHIEREQFVMDDKRIDIPSNAVWEIRVTKVVDYEGQPAYEVFANAGVAGIATYEWNGGVCWLKEMWSVEDDGVPQLLNRQTWDFTEQFVLPE
ncbi:MAG: hypothetical protein NXI04_21335 [Planctomycetaceae bacterium]|nr:hypothetical protein [Planctomycetaceae bacterium]